MMDDEPGPIDDPEPLSPVEQVQSLRQVALELIAQLEALAPKLTTFAEHLRASLEDIPDAREGWNPWP